MTDQSKESIIGLIINPDTGEFEEMTIHKDGTKDIIPIESAMSITERFDDTDTVPHDWVQPPSEETDPHPQDWTPETDSVLIHPHTKDEHVHRSVKLEALLTMIFMGKEVNCKGNMAFKAVLTQLCNIMGDDWTDNIAHIK